VSKATLLYVTDPLCSGCWAFEPAWRRLRYHYDDILTVRTVYGGLLPGWEGFGDPGAGIAAPADVAPHWLEVAARTGQPIDPAVWHTDPPSSSYPASKAAHIVRMLHPAAEERFLRRVREAVFVEARNVARRDVLVDCAAEAGVDAQAFSVLFDVDAGARDFAIDLRERRDLGVTRFPTLLVSTAGDRPRPLVVGARSWAEVESSLLSALALPGAKPTRPPTIRAALEAYASGTTLEFATLLELTPHHAESQLAAAGATRRIAGSSHYWTSNRR
jgi:protein-disulfide isomerase-like protein with CxxC motif